MRAPFCFGPQARWLGRVSDVSLRQCPSCRPAAALRHCARITPHSIASTPLRGAAVGSILVALRPAAYGTVVAAIALLAEGAIVSGIL